MAVWIVPQLRIKGRYQEWWYDYWKSLGEIVGESKIVKEKDCYFTNIQEAIDYEIETGRQVLKMAKKGDKILWLDIDFPGFFLGFASHLIKKGVQIYGYVHGAYFHEGDVWFGTPRKNVMKAELDLCRKVFVGSKYFKNKILDVLGKEYRSKIKVVGLPFSFERVRYSYKKKDRCFIFGANKIDVGIDTVEDYKQALKEAKYFVGLKKAETFGYTVLEALASGAYVLVERKFSYPEFWTRNGLLIFFENKRDLMEKLDRIKQESEQKRKERYWNTRIKLEKKYDKVLDKVAKEMEE